MQSQKPPLRIAVSARALFDLNESNDIFLNEGLDAFVKFTAAQEDVPLNPGVAFPLVRRLLELNKRTDASSPLVDIMVMTSFIPEAGVRILRSITHHGLPIVRSSFTGNVPVVKYLEAFGIDLLLSKSKEDAQSAIQNGIAAAIMYDTPSYEDDDGDQIRIAFDGDAVVFSDESERIYKAKKLEGFLENERINVRVPLPDGPFAKVLRKINGLQEIGGRDAFRVALVTARGSDARERVLRTFVANDLHVDEAHFLSGFPKAGILKAFRPHMFFDDQDVHVGPASEFVPSGLVPWIDPPEEGESKAA